MDLVNFFIKKPARWVTTHLVGIERGTPQAEAIVARLAPTAQLVLNANKGRIVDAINGFADKCAQEIQSGVFESAGLRQRLHSEITGLGLGTVIDVYVEGALYDVAIPAGEGVTVAQIRAAAARAVSAIEAL